MTDGQRVADGPTTVIRGRVQAGKGDASRWLKRFNAAYARKLDMPVFPGSLNVALDGPFDWFAPGLRPHVVWFGRDEYGGERDILLLPCTLRGLGGRRAHVQAYLWSTTTAARGRDDPWVVEVVASAGLRATYGLRDGDVVAIELPDDPGSTDPLTPPSHLPPAFGAALNAVARELAARPGVAGLLFFGSAARGTATAGSDVDLYAVTDADARGHLGRVVDGVPVEVSFGSLAQWRARVAGERPAVVHAFATGHRLLDRTGGALAALCAEAVALWARGPAPPTPEVLLALRFHLTEHARDLEALPERGAATALAGAECVRAAVEGFCAARRVWLPPARHAGTALEAHDPAFAAAVRACADAGFSAAAAVAVADAALAVLGGRLDAYDTTGLA